LLPEQQQEQQLEQAVAQEHAPQKQEQEQEQKQEQKQKQKQEFAEMEYGPMQVRLLCLLAAVHNVPLLLPA
jgi:hypothetical protein